MLAGLTFDEKITVPQLIVTPYPNRILGLHTDEIQLNIPSYHFT